MSNYIHYQIHTVVSGALDRLHYEKDPCVKYDVNRKMWIYLHRNRTEEEYGYYTVRHFYYTISYFFDTLNH